MDFLQLEYFVTAAEMKTVTGASEKLHISQSALSQMIIKLERELSVSLFYRKPRGLELTEEGAIFLEYAVETLSRRRGVIQRLKDFESEISGEIVVQANGISYLIAQIYCDFKKRYPHTGIRFVTIPELSQNDYTKDPFSSVDLFVTTCPPSSGAEGSRLLIKERFLAALPMGHRLHAEKTVSLADLKGEPFLLFQGGELQRLTEHCCRESGFSPIIQLKCHNTNILFNLVASGLGVSLFPESWEKFCNQEIELIPLRENYFRPVYLCWGEHQYLSKASSCFRDFLIDYFEHHF